MTDWQHTDAKGLKDYVMSIVAMEPTPTEREEMAELLGQLEVDELVEVLTNVMWRQPDPVYREALVKALGVQAKSFYAAYALINGDYDGALEMVTHRPELWDFAGDGMAELVFPYYEGLSPAMQERILGFFVKRFGEKTPRLDSNRSSWFRLLAVVEVTNDEVAKILVRIWGEVTESDTQNRYLLLMAMGGNPHPLYEKVFRKMRKSRISDLAVLAEGGLAELESKKT